jgi:hypothetical protein
MTLHNVVLMEDAPANLLYQGTLIEKVLRQSPVLGLELDVVGTN